MKKILVTLDEAIEKKLELIKVDSNIQSNTDVLRFCIAVAFSKLFPSYKRKKYERKK